MTEKSLPYIDSTANPQKAQARIQATLRKFGVTRIMFDDDIEAQTLMVAFKYQGHSIKFPVDYGAIAKRFLEARPWNQRRSKSKKDYEFMMLERAFSAANSMLDDLIKAMVSIADLEMYSFEEVFLGFFCAPTGERVADILVPQLNHFSNQFMLTEGGG